MRMRRFRRRKKSGLKKFLIVLAVLLLAVVLIDGQIRPLMKTLTASQARQISTMVINDAITQAIEEENGSAELVQVETTSDGKVNAVKTDIAKINKLKANATTKILEKFGEMNLREITIPIGTLLGNDFTRGRGPKIPLLVELKGNVNTEMVSDLSGAGINQTMHKIMLKVKTSVYAVIPGYNATTDVETEFCIAETVIVGEVPDSFVNLDGEFKNNVSDFTQ